MWDWCSEAGAPPSFGAVGNGNVENFSLSGRAGFARWTAAEIRR